MNLWTAPFKTPLRVLGFGELSEEARLVLVQLGLDEGERIEKRHRSPLGDPISLLVGSQLFSLRSEVCRQVRVELA